MRLSNIKEAAYIRVNMLLKQLNKVNPKKSSKETSNPVPAPETSEMKEALKFDCEMELNNIIVMIGRDISDYIYKSILSEIDWLKLDSQTIKSFHNSLDSLPRGIGFLSMNIKSKSKESDFEGFISDLVNNILIPKKQSQEALILMSRNAYLFFSVIGNLEEEKQLLLCLGFIYSGIDYHSQTGRDNLVHIMKHLLKNNRVASLSTDTLTKVQFYLIGYFDKKSKDNKEKESTVNQSNASINSNAGNQVLITLKSIIRSLTQELNSEERQNILSTAEDDCLSCNGETRQAYKEFSFEKLAFDLGPSVLNISRKDSKNVKLSSSPFDNENNSILDFNLNEKRLAEFITYICANPTFNEDKENRLSLKLIYKGYNNENFASIDDSADKKQLMTWNIENFAKIFKSTIESMDPQLIFSYLDNDSFKITDKKTLDYFNTVINTLKLPNLLLKTLLKDSWKRTDNQLITINFLLNNPNDIIKSGRKLKRPSMYDLSVLLKPNPQTQFLIEVWSNLDIFSGLLKIGSKGNMWKVRPLLDWAILNVPELVMLNLFQTPKNDYLYKEILKDTFPIILGNHTNSLAVLEDIWNLDQQRFIEFVSLLYRQIPDTMNLSKILDLTQKLKDSLIPLVSLSDESFAISLAILAVKRDFLHIDQWLSDQIEKKGDVFILALLNFLRINVVKEYNTKINTIVQGNPMSKPPNFNANSVNPMKMMTQPLNNINEQNQGIKGIPAHSYAAIKEYILEKSQLTIESIIIIFENLSENNLQNNLKVSKSTINEINVLYKQVFEIFEEMQTQPQNVEETEEKANLLFRKLFNDDTSIKSLSEQMKFFKESTNKKDNEVFACMLHSMLDEYRFFSKYPDKELNLMGSLFGKIIDMKLIDGIIESIALKYIIDGFRKGGKMLLFSTKAVEQFVDKIINWNLFLEEAYRSTRAYKGELFDKIGEKYNEYLKLNDSLGINTTSNIVGASTMNYNLTTNPNNPNPMFALNNKMIPNPNLNYMNMMPNNSQGINNMVPSNMPIGPNPLSGINQNMNKTQQKNNKFNNNDMMYPIPAMNNSQNIQYPNNSQHQINNFPGMVNQNPGNMQPMIPGKNQLNPFQHPFNPLSVKKLNPNAPVNSSINPQLSSKDIGVDSQNTATTNASNYSSNQPQVPLQQAPQPNFSHSNYLNQQQQMKFQDVIPQIYQQQGQTRLQPDSSNKIANEFYEKINIIFLKLNTITLAEKSLEIKSLIINDLLLKYFSSYLVQKKVVSEKDKQQLYCDMLIIVDMKMLFSQVIRETINKVKQLYNSEDILKDQNQRTSFRNLGSWLGLITLSRNRPLLLKEINIKELIVDGYQNGKLHIAVVLTSKILEGSLVERKNRIFHPKNPWILAINNILVEIYHLHCLEKNIRFEIEIILKKFDMDPSKLTPVTKLTENLKRCNDSPDFKTDNTPSYVPKNLMNTNIMSYPNPNKPKETNSVIEASYEDISNLLTKSTSQVLTNFALYNSEKNRNLAELTKDALTQLLCSGLVTAINQILSLVVERTVNISLITTRELVMKDFAFDCDPVKLRRAAILSIKNLAGSLATVTCKDPLKIGFMETIKKQIDKLELDWSNDLKINEFLNEVLDLGCDYIQNFVIDKAIESVKHDEVISSQIEKREKGNFLENQSSSSYFVVLNQKIKQLPSSLRPNKNGLTTEQYQIYEDFEKKHYVD